MADTPAADAAATPEKRARKPRTAKAAATPASETKSAETSAKAPRARRAAAAKSGATPTTRKASTRKPRAAATTTTVKRAVRAVEDKAADATAGVTRKRVAIGAAALAGVAAGVAAVIGRKKIAKATSDAVDAVTGAVEAKPELPQRSAD
ncbi:hypothetical protein [Sphingomonas nostoxanthinifaciens]|uniref:hypothetical protein n=1 Tax=Sphingomonas nostoxanthinifaciens TaxID=2872652 RepID=UPI001CC1E6C3|nr:hypothetical protein [Sphingomonas nostoxanthinifaciens]UAK23952.1 hypothetical protein K8P63_16565 [Sphingomonas nostoxanthinifaciens]